MTNPFHEVEQILQSNPDIAIRALLATIYLECCDECSTRLRSEEFLKKLAHMMDELKLCHRLSIQNAA